MEGQECRLEKLCEGPPAGPPCGFQGPGGAGPGPAGLDSPRLTGERQAGTPSLTSVFGLIGRDLRAAQESARIPEPDANPQEERALSGPRRRGDDYLSPSQN